MDNFFARQDTIKAALDAVIATRVDCHTSEKQRQKTLETLRNVQEKVANLAPLTDTGPAPVVVTRRKVA